MGDHILTPEIEAPHSDVERIKKDSNYLRGLLVEKINDLITGGLPEDENRLLKFHGSYMQDDRDLRNERARQKLEPAFQFMVRVLAPGGVVTPQQWLVVDDLATRYANQTIRITTRQSFQLHGILKWNLKQSIQDIHAGLLSTMAACGDVSRNVMCNPNPYQSQVHTDVHDWARRINEHLAPKTRAYHEIWLNGEKVTGDEPESEPIYGSVYLPRKFKIGIAVPPSNDVDVYSQDLGFIAITEADELIGFNVVVGGGMGMTHGDTKTYPQLGKVIGFCTPEQVTDIAEKVVTIQRDHGDRSVRKYARFKYTLDRLGMEWFRNELHARLGWVLQPARAFHFEHSGDRLGWVKGSNGRWHMTLFIQSGRVKDEGDTRLLSGLREIAKIHTGDFRLTANQNLIIANITAQKKRQISTLLEQYGLVDGSAFSALRRNSMSCVALPTCTLAMAEAERYLPDLLSKLEPILDQAGLRDDEIVIRMTGCPNGCARPALGEISFIGKSPGKYNLYMGAAFNGSRLNKIYKEGIDEDEILDTLGPILKRYAQERDLGERFGDFVIRTGYVQAVSDGTQFHAGL